MAQWFQNQFRRAEELLEVVDRTAKNVAVVRESAGSDVEEQLAALEPAGVKRPLPRERVLSTTSKPAGSQRGTVGTKKSLQNARKLQGEVNRIADVSGADTEEAKPPTAAEVEPSQVAPGSSHLSFVHSDVARATTDASASTGPTLDSGSPSGPLSRIQSKESVMEGVASDREGESPGVSSRDVNQSPGISGMKQPTELNGYISEGPFLTSDSQKGVETVEVLPGDQEFQSDSTSVERAVNGMSPDDAGHDNDSPAENGNENEEVNLPASKKLGEGGNQIMHADGDTDPGDYGKKVDEDDNGAQGQLAEHRNIQNVVAVQRELDEARGLLKNSTSSGQTKEARLARVCQQLSARLQEFKVENAQLEELLSQERDGRGSINSTAIALNQQLASAQAEVVSLKAAMAGALSSKNAELEAIAASLADTKRHAAILEGKLTSLQANNEVITKNRDATEARWIQALREELAAAERRGEDERIAHAATRQAAVEREIELEQRMTESVAALTKMQRVVEERTQKAADLEEKISLLEVECATLNQEVQAAEARFRREHKRPSEDASTAAQVQAWREEAERARALQHEAENKLIAKEAEAQQLRVELEGKKRQMDSVSGQVHAELDRRFREQTELLYLKQTQLEAMSSEKQAALLQLEKEMRRSRDARAQIEREKAMRRSVPAGDDDDQGLLPFESLGLHQRPGLSPSIHNAARFLDRGAVSAGRFLWRRPLARLALILYLMFVHLMLMLFLHRLQEQAEMILSLDMDKLQSADAAAASGRFGSRKLFTG